MRRIRMIRLVVLVSAMLGQTTSAQEATRPEAPVVLAEAAQAGQTTFVVTAPEKLWPKRPILLRSEGDQAEVHYVYAFDQNRVTVSDGLRNSYPRGSAVIQDLSEVRSAVSEGTPVIGAPSGVSSGVFPLISPFRAR